MHNVDITMAPIICSAFTLRPSTSSRGSHPQTYNCSRWLWIAWMIVSNFIGFVLELFCMCIKSFTIASFGFGVLYPWLIPSFVIQVSMRVLPHVYCYLRLGGLPILAWNLFLLSLVLATEQELLDQQHGMKYLCKYHVATSCLQQITWEGSYLMSGEQ